jgi:hypothetical protein
MSVIVPQLVLALSAPVTLLLNVMTIVLLLTLRHSTPGLPVSGNGISNVPVR